MGASTTYGDLHMNIEQRIKDLSNEELERLLKCLNFALSGEAGEAEAFKLLAEIEVARDPRERHAKFGLDS